MTTGPYASSALLYWQAGWRGILPLPVKKKANPPTGFTGEIGADPSYADIFTWVESKEGVGNIALRMPRNVIGVDVDNYGGKHGGMTLLTKEQEWGELPPTWRSTSRDDGVSGIRFYRVPEGLAWPGEIPNDIEILQHKHRYAVVCPSVHPEGRTYRWINPAGVVSTTVPDPDELPTLPDTWVEGLTGGELATSTARNTFGNRETTAWLVTLPEATTAPCARMRKAINQTPTALLGSAHAAGRNGALRVIRLASEGHAGVVTALAEIQRLFFAEATSPNRDLLSKRRRSDIEARKEWDDFVTSAVNLVTANPSAPTCDCYGQITGLLVPSAAPVTDGSSALAPEVAEEPAPAPREQESHPQEAHARLKDGAQFILDAPAELPVVWGADDEVLWAKGEALMLVGPPGVGKTTICGQVVRARLGLGGAVLGWPVIPTGRRVLYLAMDRPRQISRALRRMFSEADRQILAERLRVWEGPPPGDVARNTGILSSLAELADADTIIIDSLKDAAVGLTDDEIAAGYNRARQTALAGGVEVLELHHLVKRGPNGGKPTALADVYGSMHLTSGAGSVVLLWGAAGDPLVRLTHLKQPLTDIGPVRLLHDHTAGTTSVIHTVDPITFCTVHPNGFTAREFARAKAEDDNPTENDVEKARYQLRKLVEEGQLHQIEEPRDGGGKPVARYVMATRTNLNDAPVERESNQKRSRTNPESPDDQSERDPGPIRNDDKTAGQTTRNGPGAIGTTNHGQSRKPTPYEVGGVMESGPGLVDRTTGEILTAPQSTPDSTLDDDDDLRWDQR